MPFATVRGVAQAKKSVAAVYDPDVGLGSRRSPAPSHPLPPRAPLPVRPCHPERKPGISPVGVNHANQIGPWRIRETPHRLRDRGSMTPIENSLQGDDRDQVPYPHGRDAPPLLVFLHRDLQIRSGKSSFRFRRSNDVTA